MAISKDRLYTIVMTPLLVAMFAAAGDSIVNGNEQDARCDEITAEFAQNARSLVPELEALVDSNSDISIRFSQDMKDDPDYPRFPIVGSTTCSEYIQIEAGPAPE